jgi:hypothetical protein
MTEQLDDSWHGGNVARAIGAAAALFLLVGVIFLLNSPIADLEAEPGTYNPATATLQCGRPLLHDVDALRARQWSATPAGRDSTAVRGDDVATCVQLVGEHRTRAWVLGGLGLGLAALASVVSVRSSAVSRRRRA